MVSLAAPLKTLIAELAPASSLTPAELEASLEALLRTFTPQTAAVLKERDEIQAKVDDIYKSKKRSPTVDELRSIGYLVPPPARVQVRTENVDPELASVAGPQLVVPVDNARYALNAANARWGSMFDAVYGYDVVEDKLSGEALKRGGGYNKERGAAVIAWVFAKLDESFPMKDASGAAVPWASVDTLSVESVRGMYVLQGTSGGKGVSLKEPAAFTGFKNVSEKAGEFVLTKNGLHLVLKVDKTAPVGQQSRLGIVDVLTESALTAIMDCEDSVAAVDVADKIRVYRNWAGLMRADLVEKFQKGGKEMERKLQADLEFRSVSGGVLQLKGQALLLVRNVGLHLTTDLATLDGSMVPEHIVDLFMTALAAMADLKLVGKQGPVNSKTGSMYVVRPKMHGPREVALANALFDAVEDALKLRRYTLKIGVMDEERRTSANLAAVLEVVKDRVVFINTGFLDRTGDEIHTCMAGGAVLPKAQIKQAGWLAAYEDLNVDVGLAAGLAGRGQIGKGMWAEPDNMAAMLKAKGAHPAAGANTAWVPSPTGATLHATHYWTESVAARQMHLAMHPRGDLLEKLLTPPLAGDQRNTWSKEEVQAELDNNAQGLLGYVVRWVHMGVGCSKVPDIRNVGLMEDRATLRISSQHICNWLTHGVVSREQVLQTLDRMAEVVNKQNAGDRAYVPLTPSCLARKAAEELIFDGCKTPNGLTEYILTKYRRQYKAGGAKM